MIITTKQTEDFYKDISQRKHSIKTLRSHPFCERSIANYDDVKSAVREVFGSPFTPRIIKGLGDVDRKEIEDFIDWVSSEIFSSMNRLRSTPLTQKIFDDYHSGICDEALRRFNEILGKYSLDPIHYGQIQKLINMTFKYLACYKDAHLYGDVFDKCHMPIDSQVLKDLKKKGVNCNKPWTRLNKEEYIDLIERARKVGTGKLVDDFGVWNK